MSTWLWCVVLFLASAAAVLRGLWMVFGPWLVAEIEGELDDE